MADHHPTKATYDSFAGRVVVAVLITMAVGVLALLIWQVLDVLLLIFGAVLVATILHAIGDPIARRTLLSRTTALPIAGLIVIGVLGSAIWLLQRQVGSQVTGAVDAARNALPSVAQWFGAPGLSDYISQSLTGALSSGGMLGRVTALGTTAFQIVTNLLLIVFGGVYLAIDPDLYRDGLVKLFPAAARQRIAEMLNTSGRALKLWLLGQLFSMIVTGTLTWLALWTIGLPSAGGLGLIAGLTEFIPLLGPFLGAIPALLVASTDSVSTVLWTAVAFIVVQQVESNLIQPLITRQSVSIPPAVLLFAVIIFGALFGTLGILFAAPLTVVSFVAVKMLYVRETLGEETSVPGKD